ncbi:MAG TPA: hypothetical protein VIH17_11545 [Candidatus Acidoferrales bacterium]
MPVKLEDLGRTVGRELRRIVDYLENEVRPAAQEGTAKVLRKAALELEALAKKVEEARKSAEPKTGKPTAVDPRDVKS